MREELSCTMTFWRLTTACTKVAERSLTSTVQRSHLMVLTYRSARNDMPHLSYNVVLCYPTDQTYFLCLHQGASSPAPMTSCALRSPMLSRYSKTLSAIEKELCNLPRTSLVWPLSMPLDEKSDFFLSEILQKVLSAIMKLPTANML